MSSAFGWKEYHDYFETTNPRDKMWLLREEEIKYNLKIISKVILTTKMNKMNSIDKVS